MKIEVLQSPDAAARRAVTIIAEQARADVAARGRFVLAVSGGHSPRPMLRALADADLPWSNVHVVQVDERVAPAGHPERNLTQIQECLLAHAPLCPQQVHGMPVEVPDLNLASREYARTLQTLAGSPPVLDLAQLGLGADGHTASLVPGNPVLEVTNADVAAAGPYQGRRRMTMTFRMLGRSRKVLWLVTGKDKADALLRLFNADLTIPAGRISRGQALILADAAAAERVPASQATG